MGPQFFTGVVERFVYVTSTAISNRKSTIDEGFFGFFFCLEEKKKCPAGEAIRKYIIIFLYLNAPLGLLFLLIEKVIKKIKAVAISTNCRFIFLSLFISPYSPRSTTGTRLGSNIFNTSTWGETCRATVKGNKVKWKKQ